MILTTLSDYAKQKGITRARAYQLKDKLSLIELPVFAELADGTKIQLYKDRQPLTQTFVRQDKQALERQLDALKDKYKHCASREVYRLGNMIRAIENILK